MVWPTLQTAPTLKSLYCSPTLFYQLLLLHFQIGAGFNLSVIPTSLFCWHPFWVCLCLPQNLLAMSNWHWNSAGICCCFLFLLIVILHFWHSLSLNNVGFGTGQNCHSYGQHFTQHLGSRFRYGTLLTSHPPRMSASLFFFKILLICF